MNEHHKTSVGDDEAPVPLVEYLFYQTLAGVWPLTKPSNSELAELTERLQAYMRKALREGKVYSSWINPNRPFEEAVDHFIRGALLCSTENPFVCQVNAFVDTIKTAGLWNSLSQTLLKISSPGVPDFYQGTEIWDFSLVDPDNRRPVDYAARRQLLKGLRHTGRTGLASKIREIAENPTDGAVKLFVTSRALCFRKAHADLMTEGSYLPLRASDRRQNQVVAFARSLNQHSVIAACGRFFMSLGAPGRVPVGEEAWGESVLMLRRDLVCPVYRDVLSDARVEVVTRNGQPVLPLAQVFAHLPVALLEGVE